MFGMNDNELEVEVSSDTAGFTSGMDEAISSLGGVEGAAAAAGVAVGGLALAMGAKAVTAAADFEEAMVGVEKVTSPETAREMREEILEMSNTMPIAQEELAAVAEQAGRLGVEGSENIRDFTEVATKMGVATNLSAEEAADGFARMSTLMDLDISQAENLGSAINALSNNMATSSSEIQDAALRSSGALSQLGLGSQDILAMSAAMNEASESAQRAGSRLRRLGQEMQDPRKIEELAGAFGMTSEEFREVVENEPSRAVRMMAQAMNDGGETADELNQILGTESRTALQALGQNMEGVENATAMANNEFENATSLNEEYQAATDTFNSEVQVLKNRLQGVAITTGEALLPMLSLLVGGIADGVEMFQALNEKTDGALGTMLLATGVGVGLSGALALLGGGAGIAAGAVGALTAALGLLFSPITLAVAAVTGLYLAWENNFLGIRDTTTGVVNWVIGKLNTLVDVYNKIADKVGKKKIEPFEDVDFSKADEAREGGEETAEATAKGFRSKMQEYRGEGNAPYPTPGEAHTAGVDAGSAFTTGFESEVSGGPIKSSGLTPTMEKALKQGVDGYKSEGLEDAATEIDENLFNAVAATDKGASPESLGVGQEEFNALMSRYGGGSGVSSGARGMTGSTGGGSTRTPSASSLGKHVKTFKGAVDEFAQAVDDGLTVVVETDDGEFGRAVDARIRERERRSHRNTGSNATPR